MLLWLIVPLIIKNSIWPCNSHNISGNTITGVVGDIRTELWSKTYTSLAYKNQVIRLSNKPVGLDH